MIIGATVITFVIVYFWNILKKLYDYIIMLLVVLKICQTYVIFKVFQIIL
jgi:hypothetical protein